MAGVAGLSILAGSAQAATPNPAVAQRLAGSALSSQSWIERSGSQLVLDGQPWRFTGVNMYWLGLDENVTDQQGPTYPSHAAARAGFRAARALGTRVVRSTTLGVSVGSARSLEPTLGTFNDAAFDSIDYAVFLAHRFGMRLMIPLTDQWHFFEGGKHTFTNWLGYTDLPGQNAATSNAQREQELAFYTDPTVIAAFHAYVAELLDHVNRYTHVRLGSDPTIAFWETGNEIWDAPPDWTEQTAAYVKSLAPQSLVVDGSAASGMDIANTGYAGPDVDAVDGHFYPTDPAKAVHDAEFTAQHGKVYLVGEYPLTGSRRWAWLSTLATNPRVSGGLVWSLLPWLPNGQAEPHLDGYTVHCPGATPGEERMDELQRRYARAQESSDSG